MVTHGRVELLAHPLSQKYLQMKWNSYGKYFHLANLLFYCIFLAFVTIFAAQLMDDKCIEYANATCNESEYVVNQKVLLFKSVLSDMKLLKYFG